MKTCNTCASWIDKTVSKGKLNLERSFTKIGDTLHLGFDRPEVCQTIASYTPKTIILAGNGAVEVKDGEGCWSILEKGMEDEGLLDGNDGYQDPLVGLTWLAAYNDLLKATINCEEPLKEISGIKQRVIKKLQNYHVTDREMTCPCCKKKISVPTSSEVLILTTNWDLGLFKKFPNVVQLHGRCDYPEQAVLPLQNISLLMPNSIPGVEKLNCGILPGTFLERCLKQVQNFIFFGIGLNDYDAALWHFIRGFLKTNPNVRLGIATKDDEKSLEDSKKRVMRFFPNLPITESLCKML